MEMQPHLFSNTLVEGAPTHNQQSTTLFDTHYSIFIHFHSNTMNVFSTFLTNNLSLSPLKNHLQQSMITMKNTTSPYQPLISIEALSQNQLVDST